MANSYCIPADNIWREPELHRVSIQSFNAMHHTRFKPLCREQGNSLLWVQRREGLAFLKRNEVLVGLPLLTSSRSWKDVKILVFYWDQPRLLLKKLPTSCNASAADLKERVKSPAQQALGLRWAFFQIRKEKEKKERKKTSEELGSILIILGGGSIWLMIILILEFQGQSS